MARFTVRRIFLLLLFIGAAVLSAACEQSLVSKPSQPVDDFAEVITPPYEKRISSLARELFTKTGVELVLVTLSDLAGADPKEYAHRLYNERGLGKTGEDRGVLILVSVRERKMRIRTGTGLKAILPPRQIGEIQDRFAAPLLKQNNYDDGLLNAVVAIAKIIAKQSGVTLKEP
jgi:uncharacterized protein